MPVPEEQFIQLLSQHDRAMRAFILALTGRIEVVDDIMQETSAVLWRRRQDYDASRSFAAWARGIARLIAWDQLRRQQRQPISRDHQVLDAIEDAFSAA